MYLWAKAPCFGTVSQHNNMVKKAKNILHYPQLDTVLMVEEFISKHSGEFKKRSLWEHLPKKMMYQTFCVIIDYLEQSGKILVAKDRVIIWTHNPQRIKKLISEGLVVR